jgi:hypothetical protein
MGDRIAICVIVAIGSALATVGMDAVAASLAV